MNGTALTHQEQTELKKLEYVIEKNLSAFYEVGRALLRIRDGRLYRTTHETFEAYCKDRWGMTHRYANNLIASSQVIENLGTMVPKSEKVSQPTKDEIPLPKTERQVRPLVNLEPEKQREVWKKAVETAPLGKVTAKHVASVVKDLAKKESDTKDKSSQQASKEEDSDALYQLKRWWRAATKKDRKKFLEWIKTQ